MTKAILVSTAVCNGSGSDRYKSISGLTKAVVAKATEIDQEATILVHSNTNYQGQVYKKAVKHSGGWNHRQINDADYEIIATI